MKHLGRDDTAWRRSRGSLLAATGLLLLGLLLPTSAGAAAVQAPSEPILLVGEGSDHADLVLRALDQLAGSSEAEPRFDYIGSNEAEGLRAFLDERTDYYVGALPLDEVSPGATEQLARGRGVISAPFQATASVPFISGPYEVGLRFCDKGLRFDEENFDFSCPEPAVPLASVRSGDAGDSLRLYPESMVLLYTQSQPNDFWFEESFRSQRDPGPCPTDEFGDCLQRIDLPGTQGPVSGVRTDNAAVNKFLQEYIRELDPQLFSERVLSDFPPEQRPDYRITTRWPRSSQASRSPDETLASTIRTWGNFQSSEIPRGGSVALVHPLKAREAIELEALDTPPVTDLWIADYVHRGQVVSGTPEAITAAVASGGEQPWFAAYNDVPGAWPFSFVNRIHFPARGLTVDQTNSAALMIRLQMTVGRGLAAELADGQLSQPLAVEALEAANRVVESNCTAARGRVVKEAGAGPFTPEGLAPVLEALGPVSWCRATAQTPPPSSTTTTVQPPAPADSGPILSPGEVPFTPLDPGGFSELAPLDPGTDVPVDPLAEVAAAPPVEAVANATPAGTETDVGEEGESGIEQIAAEMPLALPGTDERAMDRLATIALGAALFFAGRALWRSGAIQQLAGAAR